MSTGWRARYPKRKKSTEVFLEDNTFFSRVFISIVLSLCLFLFLHVYGETAESLLSRDSEQLALECRVSLRAVSKLRYLVALRCQVKEHSAFLTFSFSLSFKDTTLFRDIIFAEYSAKHCHGLGYFTTYEVRVCCISHLLSLTVIRPVRGRWVNWCTFFIFYSCSHFFY